VSGRYRSDEKLSLTKHVVAAGEFVRDAGSTPAASTIFYWDFVTFLSFLTDCRQNRLLSMRKSPLDGEVRAHHRQNLFVPSGLPCLHGGSFSMR